MASIALSFDIEVSRLVLREPLEPVQEEDVGIMG